VIIGFRPDSVETQREQFILVNKTKPLPRDLLNELLPHVDTHLPRGMMLRRVSAAILETLRFDSGSPFCGRIRGIGSTGEGCNISQAAVISTIERSIKQGGVLAEFADKNFEDADTEAAARTVSVYFSAVKATWPDAWAGSPRSSRLVHGAGIYALGCLMDKIMSEVDAKSPRAKSSIKRRLARIRSRCAWTSGRWPVLKCGWNEIQNTSQDKRRLATYLLQEYERKSKR
jgi:DGQHR domain-containing protein